MLKTADDVKKFVDIVSKYEFDVDLISGRYVVDAKSILGIFSLDLDKPIQIEIYSEECEDLVGELKPYILLKRKE
jgi:phosphotransferase system HPr-like phosphotransfer protein